MSLYTTTYFGLITELMTVIAWSIQLLINADHLENMIYYYGLGICA